MKDESKATERNPYATNRGGRIEAPNAEKGQPAATAIRPAGDGRA